MKVEFSTVEQPIIDIVDILVDLLIKRINVTNSDIDMKYELTGQIHYPSTD